MNSLTLRTQPHAWRALLIRTVGTSLGQHIVAADTKPRAPARPIMPPTDELEKRLKLGGIILPNWTEALILLSGVIVPALLILLLTPEKAVKRALITFGCLLVSEIVLWIIGMMIADLPDPEQRRVG